MSTLVAAARVFARAAAIQVEEAARVAGPVAVSKAMHARDVRQRETNEAEVQAQLDAVHDAEAVHYPAPWPTAGPSTAATSPSASASVSAQAAPAPTPVERPPLPPHTPPPPPVSPELKPPAVKIAKVVKVVPQPLEIPAVEKVEPKIEVKVETKSAEHLRAEEQQALFAKAEQARLRDAARTEEQAELFARAEKANILAEAEDAASKLPPIDTDPDEAPVALRASTVPSTRLGRLFHYGSLAASLGIGAATETIRRTAGGGGEGSVFMSDSNVRRLVATLGRMRGAALKLGQFMSIQDNTILPPELERVLHQVQASANYMPDWQMEKVMVTELGKDWKSLFGAFDRIPVASASIGQVHRATLPDGTPVAVKIQFPGVAGSINSDLANLSILLRGSAVLPKGLYLQNTIAVMRRELEDECDYIREGAAGQRFHEYLKNDPVFEVPQVIESATTSKVLTTEWMSGRPLSRMKDMTQETRDRIGTSMMRLCLRELFEFRFMQTDPNWANFLYDAPTGKVQLIDFGASRAYTKEFMDGWYRLLSAALRGDREAMRTESEKLGYLTGEEEQVMLDAHLESMTALAKPFRYDGKFPFANQTITDEVRALIPVMLKHRLTPPPAPTYSLNRKLSGAFLMCAKLGANVDCKALWEEVVGNYVEGPIEGEEEAQKLLMAEARA